MARDFAMRHGGIGPDELPDIAAFVRQVSGPGAPAGGRPAAPPAEAQQRALLQVMEMGFEEPVARQALQAAQWDVEGAVARLLQ